MSIGFCGHAREIESVAAHSDTDMACLVFVGSDRANEAPIGDLLASRNSMVFDESNSVGAPRHAGTNALGKMSEVIGQGFDPNDFVRTGAEGRVFKGLARDFINDSVGLRRSNAIHDQE